jgi:CRISPR-associated endonuclease/helicase Cas3
VTTQPTFLAHRDALTGRTHDLQEHLESVARLAAERAVWPGGAWAGLVGLWHDLGKYSADFRAMLRDADAEAHIETAETACRKRVNHSSAGAQWARERAGAGPGTLLAYIIAGHHSGLADWSSETSASALKDRLRERSHLEAALAGRPPAAILQAPLTKASLPPGIDLSLWVRMIGSAVFDSDFLDTEAFFDASRSAQRGGRGALPDLAERLARRLAEKFPAPRHAVDHVRAEVLAQCRNAAARPPGLFSLTVPTGGGKTYASLAFALDHAKAHGLRRVIYAIPYTSIIEQTADAFRDVLGDETVLEHHSNLDPDPARETARSRLAAENWDTPVIVTTTVQLFESLFAARPSRCRKLHNIARSVIVLDEAQLLPPDFLRPILCVIDQLVQFYDCSVVLCTATQPSLSAVFRDFKPSEIVADPAALHRRLERVSITWPPDLHRPMPWGEVAEGLRKSPSALAIVNSRPDCRRLHSLLGAGALHLSTWQCGAHRSHIIREIRERLGRCEAVRVVSTQLVEAGVDLDFPVVWRALAGLDSIAQAAGRCNREGRLARGEVTVFVPETKSPPGHLRHAEQAARATLRNGGEPLSAAGFDDYFTQLFWSKGEAGLDRAGIMAMLRMGERVQTAEFAFRSAADAFRIIEDLQEPILVPYGPEGTSVIAALRRDPLDRNARRRAQRFVVPVRPQHAARLAEAGAVTELASGVRILEDGRLYDEMVGLVLDPRIADPEDLIA